MKYLEVISKFKTSLSEGLTALYERYGKYLYGYTLKNWQLDEDESYDILYKTMEAVGKVILRYEFSSDNHFSNWLFKIHKNNILQFVRAKKSREHIIISYNDWKQEANELENDTFLIDEFEQVIEKINGVDPYTDNSKSNPLMFAMQKALQSVSDLERDLLLLRMNNYSYDEIAVMLGIENNQLKVKFNRAKAKVQKKTLEILKDTNHEIK
jgi:RNA polymerase sigma factor (sigma-70 family)